MGVMTCSIVLPTQQVAITGSVDVLGNWERTLPLKYIGDGIWTIWFSKENYLNTLNISLL